MKRLFLTLALALALLPQLGAAKRIESADEAGARAVWRDCDAAEHIAEVDALARLVYGEARDCDVEGQAAVAWCVLNRVDDERFPDTVIDVITQYSQFFGYREDNPVLPELVEVVEDVLMRYNVEKSGVAENPGRVLPKEYVFFSGDGNQNFFTVAYAARDAWDWSLRSPYRED